MAHPLRWAYILYSDDDPGLWHQRRVLGRVASSADEFVIATPDADVYVENYGGQDPDIAGIRWSDLHRPAPPGLPRGRVYRFRAEPTVAQLANFRAQGRAAAEERWYEIANEVGDGRAPPLGNLFMDDIDVIMMEGANAAGAGGAARDVVPHGGAGGLVPPPVPVAVNPPLAAVAAGACGEGQVWVAVETSTAYSRGSPVILTEGAIIREDVAMFEHRPGFWVLARRLVQDDLERYKGAEAAGDARLLQVELAPGSTGTTIARRRRPWRDVVAVLTVCPFSDWPVPGPRTVDWCARFINRRGGGPLDHHLFFKHNYGLTKGDWGVDAHGIILHMLEEAGGYDGSEVCNLAAMELAMRHAQLVEYVYVQEHTAKETTRGGGGRGKGKGRGGSPGLIDEASVFLGTHRETGEAMICPALLEFVSAEVEKDASIMKQVRKARDERRLLNKELAGGGQESK